MGHTSKKKVGVERRLIINPEGWKYGWKTGFAK